MHALLTRISVVAEEYAQRGGWSAPLIDHLVLALFEEPEAMSVLERAGANLDLYRAALVERIGSAPKREVVGIGAALEWIEATAQEQRKPLSVHFVMGLLLRSGAKAAFAAAGVRAVDLAQVLAHGDVTRPHDSLPRARLLGGGRRFFRRRAPRCRVVLHDDEFTAVEFVVTLLIEQFRLSPPIAKELVRTISKTGRTELGEYRLDKALVAINRAHEVAREAGFPLRLTCEEV